MFDPQTIEIRYALTYAQVNLILKGLGKLPFEEVETLYTAFRGHAVDTLRAAELAAQPAAVVEAPPQDPGGE